MSRLWREPLIHFLLGGAALFLLYGMVGDAGVSRRDRVVIGPERVASLAATFERTWLRPATRAELDGLVQDFVDEEILYREALDLGLDRDDLVVRRRLRQKMEFLHLDLVEPPAPSDEELAAYLAENPERFREPERLGFRQVFLNPEAGDGDLRPRAQRLLERLRAGDVVAGDRTLLPDALEDASERDVAAVFGDEFAHDLFVLTGSDWQEPLASSYGLHLVRIEARTPARLPVLGEIRESVELEIATARREQTSRRFLETLRERYDVEVHMPTPAAD